MEKVVFANPWGLFGLWMLHSLIYIILYLVAFSSESKLLIAVLGMFIAFGTYLLLWWPLQLYKHLCSVSDRFPQYHSKTFDKLSVAITTMIALIFLFQAITFQGTDVVEKGVVQEGIETAVIFVYFLILSCVFWANAKMMGGGIGWWITQWYWIVTACFIQQRIRELHPETEAG